MTYPDVVQKLVFPRPYVICRVLATFSVVTWPQVLHAVIPLMFLPIVVVTKFLATERGAHVLFLGVFLQVGL